MSSLFFHNLFRDTEACTWFGKSQSENKKKNNDEKKISNTFVVGDVVWGAAHGCPLWPGKLVEFDTKEKEKVWVRWFGGDKTSTQVNISTLRTLSQGLDAHHRARKKLRQSRKLNTQLENAIREAMAELDRMSEQSTSDTVQSSEQSEESIQHDKKNQEHCKATVTIGRLRSSHR